MELTNIALIFLVGGICSAALYKFSAGKVSPLEYLIAFSLSWLGLGITAAYIFWVVFTGGDKDGCA